MRGWLALGGGDEFGRACIPGDRALLDALRRDRVHVAIVPTAQADGGSNPVRAGDNGVRYFEGLGATAENVLITDRASAADPALTARLAAADLIYLIGGNPGYLLRTLRETPALETIVAAWRGGTALAGSSAGAMVLCAAQIGRYSGSSEPWIAAFGLAPRTLAAVHHERTPDSEGFALRDALPAGYTVIGVDACNIAAWQPAGDWHMFGSGGVRIYRPGATAAERYTHGQRFTLDLEQPAATD
jgi:putative intracellular protease/amidase